jgi:hypothetical protein
MKSDTDKLYFQLDQVLIRHKPCFGFVACTDLTLHFVSSPASVFRGKLRVCVSWQSQPLRFAASSASAFRGKPGLCVSRQAQPLGFVASARLRESKRLEVYLPLRYPPQVTYSPTATGISHPAFIIVKSESFCIKSPPPPSDLVLG